MRPKREERETEEVYMAVPEPNEDSESDKKAQGLSYLLPKGFEETDFRGVIKCKKENFYFPDLKTHPYNSDNFRWLSDDPFDDGVVITYYRARKSGFTVPKEETKAFNYMPNVYKKEAQEQLHKKEVEGEKIKLTLDSLIETIAQEEIWNFPNNYSQVEFIIDNPRIKDDKAYIRFNPPQIQVLHPRLNIRLNFTFEDVITRCRKIAVHNPSGEISQLLKKRLLDRAGLRPPQPKSAENLFFEEKFGDDDDELHDIDALHNEYELTQEEEAIIEKRQQELDIQHEEAIKKYEVDVKTFEVLGYGVLWIGKTPFLI